jgi:hypothetical protein
VPATILGQPVEQEGVVGVRAFDGHACRAPKGVGASGMIQMAVGEKNLF